jgi:Flp pilus assembly protein TadD
MKKIPEPSQEQLNSLLEHYQAGQYADAEKLSVSITEEFPKHPFSWKVLAAVLKQIGKINESLVASQKSVQLDPQDAEAHNNLGIIMQELGRLEESEIIFKKVITLKPDYAEAHYNLGITLTKLGRLNEAEASYKKAIALKPDYTKAYNNLGIIMQELGRLDEAEISYRHAITLKPDYAEAHSNLGLVLKELGRLDEAEASYKKAITLKPDFLEAIINRWLLLFNKKRFEAALLDADLCISKGSRQLDLTTLYALGRIDEIYKRIEVKSKIDSENITIAAFASFIAEVEKKDTAYNFCPNPIDFIHYANLSTHINDSNSYIAEVIHELDSVKTIWQPSKKSTVGGFQTPSGVNLFKSPTGKIEQLKSIIINELDVYHKKYSNKSCSYIKKWPFQNYLNGWYVVLKKQGYQSPHIHPGGWLSGVIYLKVVPSLDKNEGAIEFSLNGEYYSNVNSSKVIYQPKLGDIVFFPSSLHHRTIPFSTNTDRIIVSFDLKPKQF